jgi:hypothetical protein
MRKLTCVVLASAVFAAFGMYSKYLLKLFKSSLHSRRYGCMEYSFTPWKDAVWTKTGKETASVRTNIGPEGFLRRRRAGAMLLYSASHVTNLAPACHSSTSGALFRVAGDAVGQERRSPGRAALLNRVSVLIVEDEPLIALDLAMAVEEARGKVIGPAGRVREALALMEQHLVQAAILDVNLSDRDVTPIAELLI